MFIDEAEPLLLHACIIQLGLLGVSGLSRNQFSCNQANNRISKDILATMHYFNVCRSAERMRPMCVAVVFQKNSWQAIDDK